MAQGVVAVGCLRVDTDTLGSSDGCRVQRRPRTRLSASHLRWWTLDKGGTGGWIVGCARFHLDRERWGKLERDLARRDDAPRHAVRDAEPGVVRRSECCRLELLRTLRGRRHSKGFAAGLGHMGRCRVRYVLAGGDHRRLPVQGRKSRAVGAYGGFAGVGWRGLSEPPCRGRVQRGFGSLHSGPGNGRDRRGSSPWSRGVCGGDWRRKGGSGSGTWLDRLWFGGPGGGRCGRKRCDRSACRSMAKRGSRTAGRARTGALRCSGIGLTPAGPSAEPVRQFPSWQHGSSGASSSSVRRPSMCGPGITFRAVRRLVEYSQLADKPELMRTRRNPPPCSRSPAALPSRVSTETVEAVGLKLCSGEREQLLEANACRLTYYGASSRNTARSALRVDLRVGRRITSVPALSTSYRGTSRGWPPSVLVEP